MSRPWKRKGGGGKGGGGKGGGRKGGGRKGGGEREGGEADLSDWEDQPENQNNLSLKVKREPLQREYITHGRDYIRGVAIRLIWRTAYGHST